MVMDVGMHCGQDTEYYLSLGHRVVAVEADTDLVASARVRFAEPIRSGRLKLVHCAVSDHEGVESFYIFPGKSEWNTLDPAHAQRNIATGAEYRVVQLPSRTFSSILAEFGVPYYLKVDIEGADLHCLRALEAAPELPELLSFELTMLGPSGAFEAMARLYCLGYRQFKVVDQAMLPMLAAGGGRRFEMGASGPYGDAAPGAWCDATLAWRRIQACLRMERFIASKYGARSAWIWNGLRRLRAQRRDLRRWRATLTTNSWFDLHASRVRDRARGAASR